MDIRFTPEEVAFRAEVRAFLRDHLPEPIREKLVMGRHASKEDLRAWTRILDDRGWAAPHWPVDWGGTDWSPVQHYIFNDELQQAPAPQPLPFGVSMVGPVIHTFGTEEQKERFLPRIRRLDDWWCQGFSEPGSGSDLASLRTSARREGDHYVVNGQKTWTTARPICRLDLLSRPHRPGGEEAAGDHLPPDRHDVPRNHRPPRSRRSTAGTR